MRTGWLAGKGLGEGFFGEMSAWEVSLMDIWAIRNG